MSGEEPSRREGGRVRDLVVGVEIDLQAEHEFMRIVCKERMILGYDRVLFSVE